MKKKIKRFIRQLPLLNPPRHPEKSCDCSVVSSGLADELQIARAQKKQSENEVAALKKALRECWRLTKKCNSAEAVNKVVLGALCPSDAGTPPSIKRDQSTSSSLK